MPSLGGIRQRRPTPRSILRVDLGSGLEQLLDHSRVPSLGGIRQRRPIVGVLRINLGTLKNFRN